MSESQQREVCYLRCVIKSGTLVIEWSIITPSTWDWIGLFKDKNTENRNWLNGHWFYIGNHGNRTTLPDGRHVYTGRHWIGTVSGQNQIRLNTYESRGVFKTYAYANVLNPDFANFNKTRVHYIDKGLQHLFSNHKLDWGFNADDNWNMQNRERLLETLQEFVDRNTNNVNVYIGTYRAQNAYLVADPESYQCLIVYRGGEKDYFLWSGWKLSSDQYDNVTRPPYKLNAIVLMVFEDILEQIANSEGERDDLIHLFLSIFKNDKNHYGNEVYNKLGEFFVLAESYIPLSFEWRDEITPDDNYELDFDKIRKKAGEILGELEKITL
ncbi:19594_t:CDS:1 [Funneliformis geosporum]|uniref:19594_t:CDS:1 n=1 Tax=Funneliformis geosporum TaxID=1117311 RepID=A0A9W4SYX3_9GLOM|nr:19594_t:CDS:1 [Funneliformis geosporum]